MVPNLKWYCRIWTSWSAGEMKKVSWKLLLVDFRNDLVHFLEKKQKISLKQMGYKNTRHFRNGVTQRLDSTLLFCVSSCRILFTKRCLGRGWAVLSMTQRCPGDCCVFAKLSRSIVVWISCRRVLFVRCTPLQNAAGRGYLEIVRYGISVTSSYPAVLMMTL